MLNFSKGKKTTNDAINDPKEFSMRLATESISNFASTKTDGYQKMQDIDFNKTQELEDLLSNQAFEIKILTNALVYSLSFLL